jgi:hypothetical protein
VGGGAKNIQESSEFFFKVIIKYTSKHHFGSFTKFRKVNGQAVGSMQQATLDGH